MKRLWIRLGLLGAVLVLGGLVIAEVHRRSARAQQSGETPGATSLANDSGATSASRGGASSSGEPSALDPFRARAGSEQSPPAESSVARRPPAALATDARGEADASRYPGRAASADDHFDRPLGGGDPLGLRGDSERTAASGAGVTHDPADPYVAAAAAARSADGSLGAAADNPLRATDGGVDRYAEMLEPADATGHEAAAGSALVADDGFSAARDRAANPPQPRIIAPAEAFAHDAAASDEEDEDERFAPPPRQPVVAAQAGANPPATLGAPRRLPADLPAETAPAAGRPGSKQLEGAQAPSVVVEKTAPPEIQVGKPAVFEVTVRNTGGVPARGVQVFDQVPEGTRLISTVPRATLGNRGELIWDLGTLEPGAAASVKMELMPLAEGTIGSVASVQFRADASASVIATRPQLTLDVSGPAEIMIGEELRLQIIISNPGTGVASRIILEEDVPAGLAHEAGKELEFEVGDLSPGQSRSIELILTAERAGRVVNTLRARGEAGLQAEKSLELEVVAPALEVAVSGPKRRYLQRQAVYTASVSNPGTAAAREVELVAYLPKGMKFVEANNAGTYDPEEHAVFWSLEELPANRTGEVTLVAIPIEPGEQKLRIAGRAEQGLTDEQEEIVVVEGVAAVSFQVLDLADPIEVGSEGLYEIRVANDGSKSASNVRILVDLPPEMKPLKGEGPTAAIVSGSRIAFEPLARLAPEEEQVYRIRTQAQQPGDLRIRVQLQTDEMTRPVTKEESTRVFADQ